MADIFISYTSSDREWADWVGHQLESLGHTPHIHDWEISGGGDIAAWMEERHHAADQVLCIVSSAYLDAKPYSAWERRAALWAAATDRPNFVLPVFVESCKAPTLFAPLKRCDLHGISEEEASVRLKTFLQPAAKPPRGIFPGQAKPSPGLAGSQPPFPGKTALSNVPVGVPLHFMGREDALAAIATALQRYEGRVAVTALHGMRGVGKTTLAAAYAERHRADYRATWWIRAQTEPTLRADLVGLGIRLGWVGADETEEAAVAAAIERLRHEGEGILLIFDNTINAPALKPYLPRGGAAHVLITSNAHAWRGIAEPVEIRLWPKQIGADYLIARTGQEAERAAAEALSDALGGLPLAHEQAAAYCETLDIALGEYARRFATTPAKYLDDARHAAGEYHDGLTVAKTFALAIDEAAKLHPAAEPLIVHAALLAPEQIPLFLFKEAAEKFGEPLASGLADEGLDEAVAALRTFALVEREPMADERDPAITTDAIRLHRLVREVAASRCDSAQRDVARRALLAVLAAIYPQDGSRNPASWPRCAVLTPHLIASCEAETANATETVQRAELLELAGGYFRGRAAYSAAEPLFRRALAIHEKALGPEHPRTGGSLNQLASVLRDEGDLAAARPLFERALAIHEKALGPEHPDAAESLKDLALLLRDQGDLAAARPLFERALAIAEKALGPEHFRTAASLHNLSAMLRDQGDLATARPLCERALAIYEKALGPEHPDTAGSLHNLASVLQHQGDLAAARPLYERALAIYEKTLGPEHPRTNRTRSHLARVLSASGNAGEALSSGKRALSAHEKVLGPNHKWTRDSAQVTADALDALDRAGGASALRARYRI
jgi:tetratricopeptide (TPR) repeat protein